VTKRILIVDRTARRGWPTPASDVVRSQRRAATHAGERQASCRNGVSPPTTFSAVREEFVPQACARRQAVFFNEARLQHARERFCFGSRGTQSLNDLNASRDAPRDDVGPPGRDAGLERWFGAIGRQRRSIGQKRARPFRAEAELQGSATSAACPRPREPHRPPPTTEPRALFPDTDLAGHAGDSGSRLERARDLRNGASSFGSGPGGSELRKLVPPPLRGGTLLGHTRARQAAFSAPKPWDSHGGSVAEGMGPAPDFERIPRKTAELRKRRDRAQFREYDPHNSPASSRTMH
jgi:hypothetical protein